MSKPILAALGAILAVAGFGVGHYVASSAAPAPETRPSEPAGAMPAASQADPDDARGALLEVLREPDPFARASQLASLLSGLGPEALPAIQSVLDEPFLDIESVDVLLLLRHWSRHDPKAAAGWAARGASLGARAAALELAVEQWAKADPQAALHAIGTGQPPDVAIQSALIRGWFASGDPHLEDFIYSLGMGPERQRAIDTLVRRRILRDGPEATMRWAEEVPERDDYRFKLNIFRRLGGKLAILDPALGAAWCEKHCEGPYGNNVRNWVARSWARQDGRAAMEWLVEAPPGKDRDLAVLDAFRAWQRSDVDGLKSWMATRSPEDLEPWLRPAAADYARLLAREDPLEGLAWTEVIEDEKTRTGIVVQIARRWRAGDPAAADAWLEKSPLSEEDRARVLERPRLRPEGAEEVDS